MLGLRLVNRWQGVSDSTFILYGHEVWNRFFAFATVQRGSQFTIAGGY